MDEFKNLELRIYREESQISMQELADQIGVHRETVSRWFNKSEMNPIQRHRITKAIGIILEKRAEQEQSIS